MTMDKVRHTWDGIYWAQDRDKGVRRGDVIAERYRVERVLGAGGMGVVVAARHLKLDTRVAIKVLSADLRSSREALIRFDREARAAVKIKSEHVARILDVDVLDSGLPYIVMEYLDGEDLSVWIEQRGALSIAAAAELMLQACEAMEEAHALGIIHRDLKPANLFVVRSRKGHSVKVLDFGISRMNDVAHSTAGLTGTGIGMGSPLYMPPEQLQSARSVDERSDIWALGAILYELATGGPPFDGETLPDVVNRVLYSEPTPITTYRPDVPHTFEAIVSKCLQKDRHKRYRSVAELAAALSAFAPRRSSLERISGVTPSRQPTLDESATTLRSNRGETLAAWGSTDAGPHRERNRVTLAVGAATLIVAAAGLLVARGRAATPPPKPTVAHATPSHPEPLARSRKPEHVVLAAPIAPSSRAASMAAPAASPPRTHKAHPPVAHASAKPKLVRRPLPRKPATKPATAPAATAAAPAWVVSPLVGRQ